MLRPVKLVPPVAVTIRFGNLLHCVAARGTGDVRNADGRRNLCYSFLAIRMEDGLYTDRSTKNWRLVFLAEEGDGEVAVGGWAEHTRDELTALG